MRILHLAAAGILLAAGSATAFGQPQATLRFTDLGGVSGPFTVAPGGDFYLRAIVDMPAGGEWNYFGGELSPGSGISILGFERLDPPFQPAPVLFGVFSPVVVGAGATEIGILHLGFDPAFMSGSLSVIQTPGNPAHGMQGPNCFATFIDGGASFVVPAPGAVSLLALGGLLAARRRR